MQHDIDQIAKDHDDDVMKWAEAFCERFTVVRRVDGDATDMEGTMVTWFANAMQVAVYADAERRTGQMKPSGPDF